MTARERQMMESGLYSRMSDINNDEDIFVRDDDPKHYRCASNRCPAIELHEAGRISSHWATKDNVMKYCK